MAGKDGWLYGRGVSDNKGPVLAVAAAAAELRRRQEMEVDLVMLVEGEEETGSAGFQEAVRKNRVNSTIFAWRSKSSCSRCAGPDWRRRRYPR